MASKKQPQMRRIGSSEAVSMADLQEKALAEWFQSFNSERGHWKGWESSEFLTESSRAALRTGNAHQDLENSEEVC